MSSAESRRQAVERHRNALEALAELDVDLEIVEDARALLAAVDAEDDNRGR